MIGIGIVVLSIPAISRCRAVTGNQSFKLAKVFGCVGKRVSMATTRTIG